jgi:hypothetical protein
LQICCWQAIASEHDRFSLADVADVAGSARFVGGLYEGNLLDEAIRRYECVWLPFIARNGGNASCIPPLDVAYIWHVHRLDPNYSAFCKQAFGHTLVPAHPFRFSRTKDKGGDLSSWSNWKEKERFYPPKYDANYDCRPLFSLFWRMSTP